MDQKIILSFFRLNPTNSHQVPVAVVLCGPSRTGVFGLTAARHLSSHGIKTIVYLPELPHYPRLISSELKMYKLTGEKWTNKVQGERSKGR